MEFSKVKKPAVVSNCRHVESQSIWRAKYIELFTAGDFTTGVKLSCKPEKSDMNDKLMGIVGVYVCLPWFTTKPSRHRG